MSDLDQIVRRVVRERFSAGAVADIDVSHELDDDGERIVNVTIEMGKNFGPADEARMLGLVRHIRTALADLQNDEFPMIHFVSRADAAKMRREVA